MTDRPLLSLEGVDFFERDVTMRMPFRFGVVTMTKAPQTYVRARIRFADGREASGISSELLAPKWFDKSPDLSNEGNFDQLRRSLAIAREAYEAADRDTAFGIHVQSDAAIREANERAGLPPLVASFGKALLDRAILDAMCKAERISIFTAARANRFGLTAALTPDLGDFDLDAFLATLSPAGTIHARHTVGLVDPITAADLPADKRVDDGLPETLEEVIATYGVTHFKLKVGGDLEADIERLTAIAAALDHLPSYRATLDGNEQYRDVGGVLELWRRIEATPALARLAEAIVFIEQPIARAKAFEANISDLSNEKPVEIDESDATLDAFVRAKALGYRGVSSKSCKGVYRSLLNRARCTMWNHAAGEPRYFMSAEDLTTQAGTAVEQDLALATLIGCTDVERNGHHYVNGMSAASPAEQSNFLAAHPDLYNNTHGAVRVRIEQGQISIASLDQPGLAGGAEPDFAALKPMTYAA
ncbi:mandelate racemase [Acuticoccus sp. M5D2P5]|uniref:enolase C-terminal domain-like protein n=1 Tax=Acuticoccus kalidii TaxID=2910977 RepID=UPI001F1A0CF9|nr:enolase C-terminal domain-like protein [Acuticoccus kalidii]MCF3932694.1 mandelate racemase [Acuticoccus kalidii]